MDIKEEMFGYFGDTFFIKLCPVCYHTSVFFFPVGQLKVVRM